MFYAYKSSPPLCEGASGRPFPCTYIAVKEAQDETAHCQGCLKLFRGLDYRRVRCGGHFVLLVLRWSVTTALASSSNTKCPNDRLSGDTHLVIPVPAKAGAGMTSDAQRRWVNRLVGWYNIPRCSAPCFPKQYRGCGCRVADLAAMHGGHHTVVDIVSRLHHQTCHRESGGRAIGLDRPGRVTEGGLDTGLAKRKIGAGRQWG